MTYIDYDHFIEEEYLSMNPDVNQEVSRGSCPSGLVHYEAFGRAEGRPPNKLHLTLTRKEKVLFGINSLGFGLEICPAFNPVLPKSDGFKVQTIDVMNAQDLREKYALIPDNQKQRIEDVDYIWSGKSLIDPIGPGQTYDFIIASHVLEQLADPIGFLQDCYILLNEGGSLSLVVSDKRCCFNFFHSPSSTGDLLDAHELPQEKPTTGAVFDFYSNFVQKGNSIVWQKGSLERSARLPFEKDEIVEHCEMAKTSGDSVSIHRWNFIPNSFVLILSDLVSMGLLDFGLQCRFDTVGSEFYISLSKGRGKLFLSSDRLNQLKLINRDLALDASLSS